MRVRHATITACLATMVALTAGTDPARGQTTIIRPTLPVDGLARRQAAEPVRRTAPETTDPLFEELFGADPENAKAAAEEQARADGWRVTGRRTPTTSLEPVGDPLLQADGVPETSAEGLAARYEPDPLDTVGEIVVAPNRPLDPDNPYFGAVGAAAADSRPGQRTAEDLEEVAPEPDSATDRRPARFARFEPYDPLGVRLGSFVLISEITLGGVWQSNALKSFAAASDALFAAKPRLRLMSDWSRHAVEMTLGAAPTWHRRFASEDDRAWTLDARGRLDVTRDTVLEAGFIRDVAQESRSSLNASLLGSSRADVVTDRFSAAATTRLGRFGFGLKGTLEETGYEGGDGSSSTGARDRRRTEEAFRFSYILRPTLATFAELAINQRAFGGIASTDGISRDSSGERYRAGLSFGTAGEILRGEVSVGWGRQAGDDGRLGTVSGLLLDANLGWRLTPLTSVLLSASSDFNDTLLPGVLAGTSRAGKAEVRHAFTRNLIGAADVGVTFSDYDGGLKEREISGGTQVEYYFSREVMSFARWQHTVLSSTEPGRGYTADEIGIGVRLAR